MKVLNELGAEERPMLVVFNKIDKIEDRSVLARLRTHFPDAEFISVHTGEGMDRLVERMSEYVSNGATPCELRLPLDATEMLSRLHRHSRVLEIEYLDEEVRVTAVLPARMAADFSEFIVDPVSGEKIARPEAELKW
jgi:GTP-binding protein HflX